MSDYITEHYFPTQTTWTWTDHGRQQSAIMTHINGVPFTLRVASPYDIPVSSLEEAREIVSHKASERSIRYPNGQEVYRSTVQPGDVGWGNAQIRE